MIATTFSALTLILTGLALRKLGVVRRDEADVLVRLVIYVAIPPLVFLILLRSELRPSLLLVPLVAFAVHGVLVVASLGWARLRGLDRPRTGAVIVAAAVGNTGFFGVPLIASAGEGVSPAAAVMFDVFATGIITWTSTVAIGSAYGSAGADRIQWRRVGRALLLPPNWGLAAGLALNAAGVRELPEAIERPLELAAAAVLPLVMLYVGLSLQPRGLGRVWRDVAFVTLARLVVAAGIALGLGLALGLEGPVLHTVVLLAAMPTAIMSLVIGAGEYRLNSDIIAGSILVTTLLCTASLPLIRWLLA